MYTINGKPQTRVFSQRINAGILKDYLDTKSEYEKTVCEKVDTALHIEEILTTLTKEMYSTIYASKQNGVDDYEVIF